MIEISEDIVLGLNVVTNDVQIGVSSFTNNIQLEGIPGASNIDFVLANDLFVGAALSIPIANTLYDVIANSLHASTSFTSPTATSTSGVDNIDASGLILTVSITSPVATSVSGTDIVSANNLFSVSTISSPIATTTYAAAANNLLVTSTISSPIAVDVPVVDNGVLFMKMDGNLNDETGTFSPTGSGITYSGTVGDQAAVFDATLDYIEVNNTGSQLSFGTGAFAIEVEFKQNVIKSTSLHYILNKRDGSNQEYNLFYTSNNRFRAIVRDSVQGAYIILNYNTVLTVGTFYKVRASWNGSAWKMSVNGVIQDTDINTSGTYIQMRDTGANVRIGSDATNSAFTLDGELKNLKIHDRALTDTELEAA